MNEPSAIDASSQALEQDDRFLAAIVFGSQVQRDVHLVDLERIDEDLRHSIFASGKRLFDRSHGRLPELHPASLIAYVDAEYLRRMIDRLHRDKLERAGG